MYENGKMRHFENILGMGEGVDKEGEFKYDILQELV
jgi:hypothetical protein